MTERDPNGERLPEAVVNRVLDRATALDAQHGSSVPVDVLRAAARDAGISAEAFDAALAEERRGALAPRVRSRRPLALFGAGIATLLLGVVVFSMAVYPRVRNASSSIGTVEETFLLRCVNQETAASRLRANVREKGSVKLWYNSKETSLLHVRATPEVLTKIRAELDAAEAAAPDCTVPPG